MAEKIQTSVYRISEKALDLNNGPILKKVDVDVNYITTYLTKKGYNLQKIKPNIDSNFDFHLFHKAGRNPVKWKGFISSIAEPGEAILNNAWLTNESFILISESKSTKRIYAIAGGYGSSTINRISDEDFGLDVLSRLIKKDEKTLKAVKELSLTGGVLGAVKYFRNDFNLYENDEFGNFYQEVQAVLDKDVLVNDFGFSLVDIKKSNLCIAKNSFQIKKTIDFSQYLKILKSTENILKNKKPIVEINSVVKLGKTDSNLIKILESELFKEIKSIYDGKTTSDDIDICHREFDSYMSASDYFLKFNFEKEDYLIPFTEPLRNITTIVRAINSKIPDIDSNDFLTILKDSEIITKDSNNNILTQDKFEAHIISEIKYRGNGYFVLDEDWYKIKPKFISDLNEHCQNYIDKNLTSLNLDKWRKNEKENPYNARHISSKDTLVFDKVTPRGVEACDILKWDNNNVYFIHVKKGFDKSMRELSQQVIISAKLFNEDSRTNNLYIKELYSRAKNYTGNDPYYIDVKNQFNGMTEKDFVKIISSKNPVFIFAFKNETKKKSIKDISKFNSTIAKFSISNLIKEIKKLDIDFKITEIKAA
jgi:uncharacterized protein (TIGR04141 family)